MIPKRSSNEQETQEVVAQLLRVFRRLPEFAVKRVDTRSLELPLDVDLAVKAPRVVWACAQLLDDAENPVSISAAHWYQTAVTKEGCTVRFTTLTGLTQGEAYRLDLFAVGDRDG